MVITSSLGPAQMRLLYQFEKLRPVKVAEEFDQLRDDAGPARLVAGSQTRAVVSVEIFVEQDVILPLRIGLKFLRASVHRPPARLSRRKIPVNRLAISRATSNRFIKLPEPVGHSILKLSP